MYKFTGIIIGAFKLWLSNTTSGQEHKKNYLPGVTPTNQATLNLYVSGRHEIEIPGISYRRVMPAGECSLDIELAAFPEGLCIERCLEDGKRICVSPTRKSARWSRHIIYLGPGSTVVAPDDHVMVVLAGSMEAGGEALSPGDARCTTPGMHLSSTTGSRVVLMTLI